MSLPAKTGLSLALKLKNGYPAMGGGGVSRYYTIFDPGYVDLVTPWVASGDFEAKVETYAAVSGVYIILGELSSTANALFVLSDGTVRLRINGVTESSLAGVYSFGVSRRFVVVRSGVNTVVMLDGVEIINTTSLTSTWTIDAIGVYGAGFNFDGIIYNVSLDHGTDTRYYPLDTDSLTIARETLNADGPNVFESPVVNSPWADNGDGSYTSDGSTQGDLFVAGAVTIGSAYKYKITVDVTSGTLRLRVGDTLGTSSYNITESGVYEVILTAEIANTTVRALSGFVGTVSEIQLVSTTDALYIDVQEEDKIQELP